MKPVSKSGYNKVFLKFLHRSRDCKQTTLHFIAGTLSSVGKIALIVHLLDVLDIVLTVPWFEITAKHEISTRGLCTKSQ